MSANKLLSLFALLSISMLNSGPVASGEPGGAAESRGKYIVEIGGCNDCHTAGFALSGGATPESEWLSGDSLGYRGPWGTTYPVNLRLYVGNVTEDEWVTLAQALKTRPPMPWWALNAMAADDLRAVYRYIKRLGPVEHEIPSYVPPDQIPATPYIQWPTPPE
jgi:mono/diheme cytochrome c family protein